MPGRDAEPPNAPPRRDSLTLFVALSLANGSNYLFHVVVSRLLGPSDYGALTALLAGFMIISIPAGAVQMTVARLVARRPNDAQWLGGIVRRAVRELGPIGFGVAGVLAIASPLVRSFLHLPGIASALMLAAYAAPMFLAAVYQGGLQGGMRFRHLAVAVILSTIARLVIGIGLVKVGFGVTGAAGASAASQALLVGLAWGLLRPAMASRRECTRPRESLRRESLWAAAGLTGFWVLASLDTILARHYLTAQDSGLYGAASTLSRLVLFAPGAIALIAFPRFASLTENRRALRESVIGSLTIVLGLGSLAALFTAVPRGLAIRVLFGSEYLAADSIVRFLAVAMIMLGAATILLYYHLAVKTRAAFIFWGAGAVETILIFFLHSSPTAIAAIVCVMAFAIVVLQVTTLPPLPRPVPADSELWSLPSPELDLSLVTPSYNGAVFLADSLASMQKSLRRTGLRYEIIVVSDGSTDGTSDIVRSMNADDLRLVDYEQRQGKGEALRRGMMRARGEYVAFIDSDGDLHASDLEQFLTLMETYKPDIILGSKRHPMSEVSYPPLRRLMSVTYQLLLRLLFGLNVRDTQTGIKMLRREVLADILPRMVEKRFAFDLELLVVAKTTGYRRFFEAPVSIDYKFHSTIAARPVARILLDTAAIWYRRYVLRSYTRRTLEPTRQDMIDSDRVRV